MSEFPEFVVEFDGIRCGDEPLMELETVAGLLTEQRRRNIEGDAEIESLKETLEIVENDSAMLQLVGSLREVIDRVQAERDTKRLAVLDEVLTYRKYKRTGPNEDDLSWISLIPIQRLRQEAAGKAKETEKNK